MATYFDYENAEHLTLVSAEARDADELQNIAEQAEFDAINHYVYTIIDPYRVAKIPIVTTTPGLFPSPLEKDADMGTAYYLSGFAEDADAANPGLRQALRRSVAKIITHRVKLLRTDTLRQAASDDTGTTTTNFQDVRTSFPPGWDNLLTPYDLRPSW